MPLAKKNTGRIIFLFRETFVALGVAFALMWPAHAFSSEQGVEQCFTTKNGSIVIAADSEGSVILKDGRLTASEGESIRLLPGTHIRGEEPLTVSIVSLEYQETLAEEAASEEKKQAVESILKRRESSTSPMVEALFMIRAYGGSGSRSYLSKKEHYCAVLPVRTQTSFSGPVTANHQRHSSTENQLNSFCSFADLYQPVMSWGARAETIAVMLT